MMWQPIETAPMDGTHLLLLTPKGRIADGFWSLKYNVWSWIYDLVEPTHWMPLPDPLGAQPAPSFADAYQGAMEEIAIWKKRALEAEDMNRKFIADINGPTHMGEPAQPAPIIPEGWKLVPTAESRHPDIYKMLSALHVVDNTPGASEWGSYAAFLAAAPEFKP